MPTLGCEDIDDHAVLTGGLTAHGAPGGVRAVRAARLGHGTQPHVPHHDVIMPRILPERRMIALFQSIFTTAAFEAAGHLTPCFRPLSSRCEHAGRSSHEGLCTIHSVPWRASGVGDMHAHSPRVGVYPNSLGCAPVQRAHVRELRRRSRPGQGRGADWRCSHPSFKAPHTPRPEHASRKTAVEIDPALPNGRSFMQSE